MKKIIKLLIIILILMGAYIFYNRYTTKQNTLSVKEKIELQQYKEEDAAQKKKDEELRNIVVQNIITTELHSTDKIVLLETQTTYEGVFSKEAFFSFVSNKMHVRIPYTIQIQYSTSNIEVSSTDSAGVSVNANIKGKYIIEVILDAENIEYSKDSDAWYKAEFDADELKDILAMVQSELETKYANDEEVYYKCNDALIKYIKSVSKKYDRIATVNIKE